MSGDIAVLRDADGQLHYASRHSKFAREGLANGSLVDTEEVPSASSDAEDGDDLNTRPGDDQPDKRERDPRPLNHGDGKRVAKPTPGR